MLKHNLLFPYSDVWGEISLSVFRNFRFLLAMPPAVLRAWVFVAAFKEACIDISNGLQILFFFKFKVLLYPYQTTAGQEPYLSQNGGMDDRPSHRFVLKYIFVYCCLTHLTQNPGGIQVLKDMGRDLFLLTYRSQHVPRLKSISKYYSATGKQQKINKKECFSLEPSSPFMTLVNKGCLAMPWEPGTLALILV